MSKVSYDTLRQWALMQENDAPSLKDAAKVALLTQPPDGQPEVSADGYARKRAPMGEPGAHRLAAPDPVTDWGTDFIRIVVPMCFHGYNGPRKLTRWGRVRDAVRGWWALLPCRLGLHRWVRYDITYTRESIETGPVELWRLCPLCKVTNRRISHKWRMP